MLIFGSIGLDGVMSELCCKGTVLQRNYRKMTIYECILPYLFQSEGNNSLQKVRCSYLKVMKIKKSVSIFIT